MAEMEWEDHGLRITWTSMTGAARYLSTAVLDATGRFVVKVSWTSPLKTTPPEIQTILAIIIA